MNAIATTAPSRKPGPTSSIRNLMAWLSVCVLAAAWGPALTPEGRVTWTSFGLLGLVAALGLDVIARMHRARIDQAQQEEVAVVHQRRLVEVDRECRSVQAMRQAMQRVTDIAQQHRHQYDTALAEYSSGPDDRRSEERTACWMPVELFLDPDAFGCGDADGANRNIVAYVRNLSGSGVGLYHHKPIGAVEAVMRIRSGEGDELALLATRCWCRPTDDGWHHSGWKLVEVLSTVIENVEPVLCGAATADC
jgi:hypothetical protein